jgi:hypothetical protein
MANESLMESLSLNLPAMAQIIKKKGRGKDTLLAHITPEEAKLLKKRGGRGSINPKTGLLEFDDFSSGLETGGGYDPSTGAMAQAPVDVSTPAPVTPESMVSNFPSTTGTTGTTGGGDYIGNIDYSQISPTGIYAQPTSTYAETTPSMGINLTPAQQAAIAPQLSSGAEAQIPPVPETPTTPQQNVLDKLKSLTGLSGTDLARYGLTGGLGLLGLSQQKKAQQQINQAQGQEQAIAAPYQQQGQELVRQAQAGELTPASQQAYQAAQAQIQQGIAQRGGVGEAQAANQLSNIYQNLLNNQYNYGLQISQIGDQYAIGAIKTGLQLDQQLNTATTNFYGQLAQFAAGGTFAQPKNP